MGAAELQSIWKAGVWRRNPALVRVLGVSAFFLRVALDWVCHQPWLEVGSVAGQLFDFPGEP